MDPVTASALIGAGTSLAGGLMGKSASDKAQEANKAQAEQNIALQREFAQNGIRWKVEDAKAAGVHPLFALGASGSSFSPVSLGAQADNSMPSAMADIGQNISRAVGATRTGEEKAVATLNLAQAQANLDGQLIDNQIKAKQLHSIGNANPPMAGSTNFIPGQGNSPVVKINPSERVASQPGRLAQEAGWTPDVGYSRTDTGLTPVPSRDVKERIEDQLIPELMWAARNQIAPNFGTASPPPKNQLPKGAHEWKWSFWKQEWQPKYNKTIPFGGHK